MHEEFQHTLDCIATLLLTRSVVVIATAAASALQAKTTIKETILTQYGRTTRKSPMQIDERIYLPLNR